MTVRYHGNMDLKSKKFKLKSSHGHMGLKTLKSKLNFNQYVYNFEKMKSKEYIATPNLDIVNQVTFQKAMKLTILIGQVFGLNPVIGITENDAFKLRFSFFSKRCIYTIVSIFGQGVLVIFCVLRIFTDGSANLSSNSATAFYASNCIITIMFLRVAMRWPKLCRYIAKIEAVDPNTDKSLAWKCIITCAVVLILATVEHTLADFSDLAAAMACQPDKNPYDAFLVRNFHWIWISIPYNQVLGILWKLLNIQCTFNWNYSNAFIMCLCWYLTARLQQINNRLNDVKGQVVPSSFWKTMREDYTKASHLVRQVDDVVNGITFVAYASNLFSICLLLFHTLEEGLKPTAACFVVASDRPLRGYEHVIYFLFSLTFIISRSLAMSLIAAKVNSASTQTVYALYEVPSEGFCIEVQRFIDQIHGDSVVLSGLNFFSVKRGMILTIAATIVTYELVLIQFTGTVTRAVAST